MKLKKSAIKVMSRDDLRRVVDALGITSVDRRDRGSMAKSVGRWQDIGAAYLLGFLSEVQVKEVCELVGADPRCPSEVPGASGGLRTLRGGLPRGGGRTKDLADAEVLESLSLLFTAPAATPSGGAPERRALLVTG